MAEFHENKISLWAKLLGVLAGIALLIGATMLTLSLSDSRVFRLHAKGVNNQVRSEHRSALASSYLEYLPVKAQMWARDTRQLKNNLSVVGLFVAAFVLALIAFGIVLGGRRGQYNHDSLIDQMYERRFIELKARFMKLLGRV